MRKKFIGPANLGPDGKDMGHEVVVAGQALGTVRPGEVVEVPDELAGAVAWPEQLWEDEAQADGGDAPAEPAAEVGEVRSTRKRSEG